MDRRILIRRTVFSRPDYDGTCRHELEAPLKKTIIYIYRGRIVGGTGGGYRWHDGYSENNADDLPLYPWLTRRECQQDAKRQGGKAVFSGPGAKRFEPEVKQ